MTASIRDAIKAIAAGQQTVTVEACTITAVDWAARTCDCSPEDGPDLYDVRLRAQRGTDSATGLYGKPAVGAAALVALVDGNPADAYLLACDRYTEWVLAPDGQAELRITPDGFVLTRSGESLGALLQDLLAAIQQLTVTTALGPSGPPINLPAFDTLSNRFQTLFK